MNATAKSAFDFSVEKTFHSSEQKLLFLSRVVKIVVMRKRREEVESLYRRGRDVWTRERLERERGEREGPLPLGRQGSRVKVGFPRYANVLSPVDTSPTRTLKAPKEKKLKYLKKY